MRKILITMFLLSIFVVVSCDGVEKTIDVKSGVGESCTKTSDCKTGLKCIDQVCVDDSGDTGNTGDTGDTGDTGVPEIPEIPVK
mgnify:CR=1 FL=1